MAVILKDGASDSRYEIYIETGVGTEHLGTVSANRKVDACRPIIFYPNLRTMPFGNFPLIQDVVGVCLPPKNLIKKLYSVALAEAQHYAKSVNVNFVDETSRAKESPLAK